MKQGDTVFVSATATGLGKDKKAVIDKIENVMVLLLSPLHIPILMLSQVLAAVLLPPIS